MADSDTGDKTEKASAQKLRKAREQGQSVRSRDLTIAISPVIPGSASKLLELSSGSS